MEAAQKEYLDEQFGVKEWHGRSASGRRSVKGFAIETLELKSWRLQRVKRDQCDGIIMLLSMWSRGDSMDELLSIEVFECPSVKTAHDQLLELLANVQSPKVERVTEKNAPGDVAFGLLNTMLLFARANLVVQIRNAGPRVVPVGIVGREMDAQILRRLEPE